MSYHLKRIASPRAWPLPRKTAVWAVKPRAGPHPSDRAIPLGTAVRDLLHLADTMREARRVLGQRMIEVDGRVVLDYKRPVGLMDVVTFTPTKESYRVVIDRQGKLCLVRITAQEAKWKLGRIVGKHTVKGGLFQLTLHDGRNILQAKNTFKSGDVLKVSLPQQKILESYKFAHGSIALLTGGSHAGEIATIEGIDVIHSSAPNVVRFKDGFSTVCDHVFVVGHKKPEISLPEVAAL